VLRRTITTDRSGVIHQWGSDAAELFGYSADDIHGRQFDVLIPPALRPLVWHGFNKAIQNGYLTRHGGFNVPAIDKAGNLLLARIEVALSPGDNGDVDGIVATVLGRGSRWQAAVWQVALAPLNLPELLRERILAFIPNTP
jgi:PAS domain S-box-containing protein